MEQAAIVCLTLLCCSPIQPGLLFEIDFPDIVTNSVLNTPCANGFSSIGDDCARTVDDLNNGGPRPNPFNVFVPLPQSAPAPTQEAATAATPTDQTAAPTLSDEDFLGLLDDDLSDPPEESPLTTVETHPALQGDDDEFLRDLCRGIEDLCFGAGRGTEQASEAPESADEAAASGSLGGLGGSDGADSADSGAESTPRQWVWWVAAAAGGVVLAVTVTALAVLLLRRRRERRVVTV